MEGPFEKSKKTMEKIYREAEPNQDFERLKIYTSAPWQIIKNRLLFLECTKTPNLDELNKEQILNLINEGAEPIYFDIKGKIALHTIAEAGWIQSLPEGKFESWKELFNWPDTCCISPIGYTLLNNNIEDGTKFWQNEEHANLLIQFILCGNGDKNLKMNILGQIFQHKKDRLRSTHMDKAVRTVDIIRTKKSETVKNALKRKESYGSLEENLNVIKLFYKERKLSSVDGPNGFSDNGHNDQHVYHRAPIGDNNDVFANEEIERYDLSGDKYLLIINVTKYPDDERKGAKDDERLLRSKFKAMGFKSELNGLKLELTDIVKKNEAVEFFDRVARDLEEVKLCALAVVIMAHGTEQDKIKFSDEKPYGFRALIRPLLACKNLNRKPKIFVTQFCRGESEMPGAIQTDDEVWHFDGDTNRKPPVNDQLDMVICYATAPGNLAVRKNDGSAFIKLFGRFLEKGVSIESIMKRVTSNICDENYSIEYQEDRVTVKIAPQLESTLRKELIF